MQNSSSNASWSPGPFLVSDQLLGPAIVKQLGTVEKQKVKILEILDLQQGLISQTHSHELF